jgi:hypothetical protein
MLLCTTLELRKSQLKRKLKKSTSTALIPAVAPSIPGRLEPRLMTKPIAVGKPCWILPPDHDPDIVAFGKSGTSRKTKARNCASMESKWFWFMEPTRKVFPS